MMSTLERNVGAEISIEDLEQELRAYELFYGISTADLLALIDSGDDAIEAIDDAGFWRSTHELLSRLRETPKATPEETTEGSKESSVFFMPLDLEAYAKDSEHLVKAIKASLDTSSELVFSKVGSPILSTRITGLCRRPTGFVLKVKEYFNADVTANITVKDYRYTFLQNGAELLRIETQRGHPEHAHFPPRFLSGNGRHFNIDRWKAEGRVNVAATVRTVAKAANVFDVGTIVVFAATAASVIKLRSLVDDSRVVVAVTFPAGLSISVDDKKVMAGMPSVDDRESLAKVGVTLIQGVMPFRSLGDQDSEQLRTLRRAFGFFGGGLQLCVQAVLMAADAGQLPWNERCIAMSADTAIVANAEHSFRFLHGDSRFAIEHVLCKPISYSITNPLIQKPAPISMAQAATERIAIESDLEDRDEGTTPPVPL